MAILNFGSLNVDRVVRVGHIVREGETVAARSLREFAGGKGANQSVALARAGAAVVHLGKVGPDGRWLIDRLAAEGVDIRSIGVAEGPSGQALIQVDDAGGNAIVVIAGANHEISPAEVDAAIAEGAAGDWLLVQNETSAVGHAIHRARERGLRVAFNPAPADERVAGYPLELVDLLCLNESEAAALTGHPTPETAIAELAALLPACEIVLTLGPKGLLRAAEGSLAAHPAVRIEAIDTTAAGDTFLGYYLAALVRGLPPDERLRMATRAAALCVSRAGAIDSIPQWEEVARFGAAV